MIVADKPVETKQLLLTTGALAVFDALFVKVPFYHSNVVNPWLIWTMGPATLIGGLGLIGYSLSMKN